MKYSTQAGILGATEVGVDWPTLLSFHYTDHLFTIN